MGQIYKAFREKLGDDLPDALGVAVSGGGDSVALLLLLRQFVQETGRKLSVATVDHGLRPEAASEACWVADLCESLKLEHKTLTWRGWDGSGNLQSAARDARYRLLSEWGSQLGLSAIALGHTLDDQAETVVMRLARGAGVDGLSGMAPERSYLGANWLRPLLSFRRVALRDYLGECNQTWLEDPSNEDISFARIQARKAMGEFSALGIDAETLGQVAGNMARARAALSLQAREVAKERISFIAGGMVMDHFVSNDLPEEISRRLLLEAVRWLTASAYKPRGSSLDAAQRALRSDGSATLNGCRLKLHNSKLWIFREFAAVKDIEVQADGFWDKSWRFSGRAAMETLSVRALGASGLAQVPDWRSTGLPRALLMASPALWQNDELVSAPHAGWANGWRLSRDKDASSFFNALLAH